MEAVVGRGGRVQVTWESVEAEGSNRQSCPQTLIVFLEGSCKRFERRPAWARVRLQPPAKEQSILDWRAVTVGELVKLIFTA